jgi:hypothetical protein
MQWTHSETIGLASAKCTKCHGAGLVPGSRRKWDEPCRCVLRAVFTACLNHYHYCAAQEPFRSRVVLHPVKGQDSNASWSRKNEDFICDFYLIAKRTLPEREFKIFRLHFLAGHPWRDCCLRLEIDRGTFYHAVYRIAELMGRTYREIEPYALFPCDEYFGGVTRKQKVEASIPIDRGRRRLINFPLELAA